MNMVYKKYSVCDTLEKALTNISIISQNMSRDGDLDIGETWTTPIPVTGLYDLGVEPKHVTGKYYFINPDKKYMVGSMCEEQTDINPNKNKIEYYKIYDYINDDNKSKFRDWTKAPHSLDYKIGLNIKLQPDYKYDKLGNVVDVIYYLNVTSNEYGQLVYSDPILKYKATYFYNQNDGYVTHRTVERDWILTNGEWSNNKKTTTKYYTKIQSRNIGLRRRRALIDNVIVETGFFVLLTEGLQTVRQAEIIAKPFLDESSASLSSYYESGNMDDSSTGTFPLYDTILNSSHSFLNNVIPSQYTGMEGITIRMYMLNRVDVDALTI